jgi:hypothetical protein
MRRKRPKTILPENYETELVYEGGLFIPNYEFLLFGPSQRRQLL